MTQLALGGRHLVACTHGGRVATFGANDYGLLGLGSDEPPNPFQPSLIPDVTLEQASQLVLQTILTEVPVLQIWNVYLSYSNPVIGDAGRGRLAAQCRSKQ